MMYPFQNGFLDFTLGVLFILTVYHLLLFIQNRQRIYLLYSGYTFFIIMSQLGRVTDGFIHELITPLAQLIEFPELYTETYYIIYLFFAFRFLEVNIEFPRWSRGLKRSVYLLIVFCAAKFLIYLFTGRYEWVAMGYYVFVVYMLVLSIFAYYLFFSVTHPLRYYIIVGSLILLVTSYASLLYYESLKESGVRVEPAFAVLYLGFILENLLFSLGLGHKQKIEIKDRKETQGRLIAQLQENERLRQKMQLRMEDELRQISKMAEEDKLVALKAKYDKEFTELRLASLRSQMNPHFIFNSLNSIKRYIIENEKEQAVYYLNKFSKLIRMILATTTQKEVSLLEEIETMKLYLEIENIRFGNQLEYAIEVSEGLDVNRIKFPSLLLQPFLENAIWHGLSLKEGKKQLVIRVSANGENHLRIEMEDNGIGRRRAQELKNEKRIKRESMGIRLTRERLDKFAESCNQDYSLEFTDLAGPDGDPKGTLVVLLLPLD